MKSLLRVPFVITLLATLVVAGCSQDVSYNAHDVTGLMPDLSFQLTDENDQQVTAADYAGAPLTLLFFGYTNCPDVCPMTLSRLSSAIAGLAPDMQDKVKVLFVSVDPKRDTPQQLQKYTAHFGPQFVGLTGSQKELTRFTKVMRVTYGYGEPDPNTGFYLVSHSAAVFVFDNQQQVRLLINQQEKVAAITADLQTLLDVTT